MTRTLIRTWSPTTCTPPSTTNAAPRTRATPGTSVPLPGDPDPARDGTTTMPRVPGEVGDQRITDTETQGRVPRVGAARIERHDRDHRHSLGSEPRVSANRPPHDPGEHRDQHDGRDPRERGPFAPGGRTVDRGDGGGDRRRFRRRRRRAPPGRGASRAHSDNGRRGRVPWRGPRWRRAPVRAPGRGLAPGP